MIEIVLYNILTANQH